MATLYISVSAGGRSIGPLWLLREQTGRQRVKGFSSSDLHSGGAGVVTGMVAPPGGEVSLPRRGVSDADVLGGPDPHVEPPGEVEKDRRERGEGDPRRHGHVVAIDSGARRLERPRLVVDLDPADAPSPDRVEADALREPVLERAGRRPGDFARRLVVATERGGGAADGHPRR